MGSQILIIVSLLVHVYNFQMLLHFLVTTTIAFLLHCVYYMLSNLILLLMSINNGLMYRMKAGYFKEINRIELALYSKLAVIPISIFSFKEITSGIPAVTQ